MARSWAAMGPEIKKWGNRNMRTLQKLGDYDVDDWLGTVGLRRRSSFASQTATVAGLVLGGVALGLVAGMFLAPKSGKEIRSDIAVKGRKAMSRRCGDGQTVEGEELSSTNV